MRPNRPIPLLVRLLPFAVAAGALHGAVLVTLSTSPNALSDGQSASLVALVTGTTNTAVTWGFSPTVAGATVGPATGPDSSGTSTNTYQAPSPVTGTTKVTVTAS